MPVSTTLRSSDQQQQRQRQRPALPAFNTERFALVPLEPEKLHELARVLLCDEHLAARLPWMKDKGGDAAAKEAFLLKLQCASGTLDAWGIVERARAMFVGALLARWSLEGIDVEVLCASQFWDHGVADEASEPVLAWLEHRIDAEAMSA